MGHGIVHKRVVFRVGLALSKGSALRQAFKEAARQALAPGCRLEIVDDVTGFIDARDRLVQQDACDFIVLEPLDRSVRPDALVEELAAAKRSHVGILAAACDPSEDQVLNAWKLGAVGLWQPGTPNTVFARTIARMMRRAVDAQRVVPAPAQSGGGVSIYFSDLSDATRMGRRTILIPATDLISLTHVNEDSKGVVIKTIRQTLLARGRTVANFIGSRDARQLVTLRRGMCASVQAVVGWSGFGFSAVPGAPEGSAVQLCDGEWVTVARREVERVRVALDLPSPLRSGLAAISN